MLESLIEQCRSCPLGDGNSWCPGEGPNALKTPMVIGMNPGATEALEKRPFIGPCARIRELFPEDCYYTNVVKCAGRVARCQCCRFISLEIKALAPLKMVLLGGEACKRMTGMPFKAGTIYNVPTHYGAVQAFVTWHPSPANNGNWQRLIAMSKDICNWLKE